MKKLLSAVLLVGLAFAACKKEYSIENGQSGSLTGAWEFKDSANTLLFGNPTQYYIDDTSNTASAQMVYIGATPNLSATISIEVFFPTGTATTGSFQSANGQVNFLYLFNSSGKFYKVDAFAGQFSTENITVNITQISDSSVTGTFSGTALDSTNRLVPIKEGKFSYRKQSIAPPPPPPVSIGTLGTVVDTCMGAVVSGTYRKNVALTGANTVTLTVNVSTPGTYSISSDTLKGIAFKGTGSFTAIGIQSVVIQGVGTPTDSAAALRFRVRYGTSSCTFLVKIDTAGTVIVVPPTGDYFPTTATSNWSYDIIDETSALVDTIYTISPGTSTTIAGNSYNIFTHSDGGLFLDSGYYRKNAGIYYDASLVQDLFISGTAQPTQFLKDNVPNGNTWTESFNVNFLGQNVTAKLDYTILAKAVPATINSFSFQDVIKVRTVVTTGLLGVFAPYETSENWFARGTGLIYNKTVDNTPGSTSFTEAKLRRFIIVP